MGEAGKPGAAEIESGVRQGSAPHLIQPVKVL
jgi:hypothetical protein